MKPNCVTAVQEAAKKLGRNALTAAQLQAIDDRINATMRRLARTDPDWQAKSTDQRVIEAAQAAMADIQAEAARKVANAQRQILKTAATDIRITEGMAQFKEGRSRALVNDIDNTGHYINGIKQEAVGNMVDLMEATNKDLIEEVKNGHFREDLYYRLNVFPITIPALRKRKEDIPHLVRVFTERFSSEQKNGHRMSVSSGALALLTSYDWPGNIRQLENAIFRAVVLAEGGELTEADFPQIAAQLPEYEVVDHLALVADNTRVDRQNDFSATDYPAHQASVEEAVARITEAPDNAIASTNPAGDVRKLADVEEELIRFALKFYRGQMSQVARKLGIGRSTLYRKLKDYGIDPDNPLKDAA